MSFFKAIGRLFGGEKPKQSNPVKAIQDDRPKMASLDRKSNSSGVQVSKPNTALVAELNKCRASIARREGIKPYMVFTDRQLYAIADGKPISEKELSWIEGFEEEKVFKYGTEIIKIFKYR